MNPLVSILIPAFNSQEWIAATIRSAMNQTWGSKEIVIVDDGSTDSTQEIARQFECANVLVVSQENEGASAARNKALSCSQGDYIQWLDADDLICREKIALQMDQVNNGESARTLLSSEWAYFLYRPHRAIFEPTALWADLTPTEWLIRQMSLNLHMQTSTWLVSRELTTSAGPWDTRLSTDDDGEYFARVLRKSSAVKFVPGAKTYYRVRGSSSLSYIGNSRRKLESQLLSMRLRIGYLRTLEQGQRVDAAILSYLETWYPLFFPGHPDLIAELQRLAESAGGSLAEPQLSRKYSWLRKLFGWRVAQRTGTVLRGLKWSALAQWDRFCSRFDSGSLLR